MTYSNPSSIPGETEVQLKKAQEVQPSLEVLTQATHLPSQGRNHLQSSIVEVELLQEGVP
jgi:hypothetical protein